MCSADADRGVSKRICSVKAAGGVRVAGDGGCGQRLLSPLASIYCPSTGPCQQHLVGFPVERHVVTTAETGSRASQFVKNPQIQRLARGLWMLRREPLTLSEGALLRQKHLAGPDSGPLVSGVSALDLMRMPVGGTDPWVEVALGRGRSASVLTRRSANSEGLAATGQRVELLWTTHRIQSQQDGVRIAESRWFAALPGPWETQIVHPLEVLARLAGRACGGGVQRRRPRQGGRAVP